jgi:hypothetical protein
MPQAEKFVSEGIEARGFELWFRKEALEPGFLKLGFVSERLHPKLWIRKGLCQEAGRLCSRNGLWQGGSAARMDLRRGWICGEEGSAAGNVSYQGIALAMPKQMSVLSAFRRCLEGNAIADTRARVN